MPELVDLRFSQNNLQDFVDCPRRFYLRHVLRLAWPALQTEPVIEQEHRIDLGYRFHQLAEQFFSGVPAEALSETAEADADLSRWWKNFLTAKPLSFPGKRYSELMLSGNYHNARLLAKYDLLVVNSGKDIWIMDWKTSSSKPRRSSLQDRIQTRLYPFLLVEAGKGINQAVDIRPEQVQMMYWYPEFPDQAVIFQYSEEYHQANALLLKNLILEIQGMQPDDFQKTTDERRCRFCHYRSLCERGGKAGNLLEFDTEDESDESELSLDLEQIGEIEF